MFVHGWLVVTSTLAVGSLCEMRRAGWLDRVVLNVRNKFIEDVNQVLPTNIQASIEKAPAGYVDSTAWNFDSVARLLKLIRASETARPVRASLRRMLAPQTRRFMHMQKTYKLFPSLTNQHLNNFYYDDEPNSDEYYDYLDDGKKNVKPPPDNAVVVVRNPVESRLPSARISVKLLREILEARALAARIMPSPKTTPKRQWPTSKTTKTPSRVTTGVTVAATESEQKESATGGSQKGGPVTEGPLTEGSQKEASSSSSITAGGDAIADPAADKPVEPPADKPDEPPADKPDEPPADPPAEPTEPPKEE